MSFFPNCSSIFNYTHSEFSPVNVPIRKTRLVSVSFLNITYNFILSDRTFVQLQGFL